MKMNQLLLRQGLFQTDFRQVEADNHDNLYRNYITIVDFINAYGSRHEKEVLQFVN